MTLPSISKKLHSFRSSLRVPHRPTVDFVRKLTNVILCLLILNFLSLNFGPFSPYLYRLCGFFLMIAVALVNFPLTPKKIFRKEVGIRFLFILLPLGILFLSTDRIFWLLSTCIFIFWLDVTLRSLGERREEFKVLSLTALAYALFIIFCTYIPQLWYSIREASILFSGGVGYIIRKPLALGPSASGTLIFMIFFFCSIAIFFFSKRNRRRFAFCVIGLVIANAIYLAIQAFFFSGSALEAINSQYIFFFIGLIPLLAYIGLSKMINIDLHGVKLPNKLGVLVLVLLLPSATFLTVYPIRAGGSGGNVRIYAENMLGNFSRPEYGRYGQQAGGFYGILPEYLGALGYRVDNWENAITDETFRGVDIFVVICPMRAFTAQEHKLIWEFVDNGGDLLVLGDHTDIDGIMGPLNELLRPVNIEFRFDSGYPVKTGWESSLGLVPHPVTTGVDALKEIDEISISVGASLNAGSASTVIIGKYGLSDLGDYANVNAYLGDFSYNLGERLGDIILVAGAEYGKGKVLVFGDTSPFQNTALPTSHKFVSNAFAWLRGEGLSGIYYIRIVLALVLSLMVLFLLVKMKNIYLPCLLILCLALAISGWANAALVQKEILSGPIAYVDYSHGERFSLHSFDDYGVEGLTLNLMRENYLPLTYKDFSREAISSSSMLVLIAPTQTFTGDEVNFLKEYVADGGVIVLSTGYPDSYASEPLLKEFGFEILDAPLGPVPYVEEAPENFVMEPRFADSWAIESNWENTQWFYTMTIENESYHLVGFNRYGAGGLLLIGDSRFLMNKNLEMSLPDFDYWPGNIQFLKDIIDNLRGQEVLR
jgi:hypothetical protein